MARLSGLYRRPSGIYAVRIAVPERLRCLLGRREIHASTSCYVLEEAVVAALKIQLSWREQFKVLRMDVTQIVAGSPLLQGQGFIRAEEAARVAGLQVQTLLSELLNIRAPIFVMGKRWPGWQVSDLDRVERDWDGSYLTSSIQQHGEPLSLSLTVQCSDSHSALDGLLSASEFRESLFLVPNSTGAFFSDEEVSIPLSACMVLKTTVEGVRARLASTITPAMLEALKIAATPLPVVVMHPIIAKHGKKRISTVFDMMKATKSWGLDQSRRMETEIGLFCELMHDPEIGDIDVEMIQAYRAKLACLPSHIDRVKRRNGVATLDDVIEIADRDGMERKNGDTIRRHVSRLSELFIWAVASGMMLVNPATAAGGGRKKKSKRDQDERDAFTPAELAQIFSAEWFQTGTGVFFGKGWTRWRPYYYWLPLMGVYVGGRISELSQLYLDDIVQTASGTWYFDFNLNTPDKVKDEGANDNSDLDEDIGPKSLKTVNAIRIVPVHEELLRLGLISYVSALRDAGYDRLFPEIKRDHVKGYGKPSGSWFNERFLGKGLGMERNGRKVFHSLRHNFVSVLDSLEVLESTTAQLVGHERGTTMSAKRYRKDRSADALTGTVNAIGYDLPEIGPFDPGMGLRAIHSALRQKNANRREAKPKAGGIHHRSRKV